MTHPYTTLREHMSVAAQKQAKEHAEALLALMTDEENQQLLEESLQEYEDVWKALATR